MTRRCTCGGALAQHTIEVPIGGVATLDDIEQWRCEICGQNAYPLATLQRVEAVFHGVSLGGPRAGQLVVDDDEGMSSMP
ncbi:hypothetical protein [Cryptosporangium aurantiacum]|uniref:YgiT-type zinc finger domain-containing protein n=1 Tax=Cryptosporangium aurantiacum TaxID=134849 RepID=A0A1M7KUX9_9ACTN|nr:hypothetical protein [Cryptosporangium aurantiacum]SHM69381.1 hypothetical protein SAMN05443668_1011269 [Cryptosporangium aurantiacum]